MPLLRNVRAALPARLIRAGITAGALMLFALPAQGQILAMATAPDTPETDPVELEAKAWDLVQREGKYRQAARLYVEAATARGDADPVSIENLRLAANLYFFSGDESKAQDIMLDAGEAALAMGDVAGAANRFLDAAWVASDRGDAAFVVEVSRRARLLTASPLLDSATRREVLQRIQVPADAQAPIVAAQR